MYTCTNIWFTEINTYSLPSRSLQPIKSETDKFESSCYGATGLVMSLQHQDIGSVPGLAQWVKGSCVAAAMAWI